MSDLRYILQHMQGGTRRPKKGTWKYFLSQVHKRIKKYGGTYRDAMITASPWFDEYKSNPELLNDIINEAAQDFYSDLCARLPRRRLELDGKSEDESDESEDESECRKIRDDISGLREMIRDISIRRGEYEESSPYPPPPPPPPSDSLFVPKLSQEEREEMKRRREEAKEKREKTATPRLMSAREMMLEELKKRLEQRGVIQGEGRRRRKTRRRKIF